MRSQPGGGDYAIAAAIGFFSVKPIGQGTGSQGGERPETKPAPQGGESPLGRPLPAVNPPGPATGLQGGRINLDPGNGHIRNDAEAMKLWSRDYEPGWEPKV